MKLYVIRHGETQWNRMRRVQGHQDIPLNEYGRRLAEETAEGMREIPIDLAYTSPLCRAKETAEILLRGRNVPLIEDDRVKELCFGGYEGMCCSGENREPGSDVFNRFFTDTANYVPLPDGESIDSLYDRTGDFLREMCERADLAEKNVLVSTHGAAMNALLNQVRGSRSVSRFWEHEVPPNCAVTIVDISGGRAAIAQECVIFHRQEVRKWKAV